MGSIDGVGGAFIFSNDARALAQWYRDNLGLNFENDEDYKASYQMFIGLDPENPERKLDTTFAIMQAVKPLQKIELPDPEPDSMYGDQPFMINLRSRDLDKLLSDLESKGINIIKRQDEVYGKFAWIRDADGNRVELYQPAAHQI